jgi:hypothetical protein
VATFNPDPSMIAGEWQVGQTVTLSGFVNGKAIRANDASFNGTCVISVADNNDFSCPQSGPIVASHSTSVDAWTTNTAYLVNQYAKNSGYYRCILVHTSSSTTKPGTGVNWQTYWVDASPYKGNSVASFAPITPGSYIFWMGARDGAFQIARAPITVVVVP